VPNVTWGTKAHIKKFKFRSPSFGGRKGRAPLRDIDDLLLVRRPPLSQPTIAFAGMSLHAELFRNQNLSKCSQIFSLNKSNCHLIGNQVGVSRNCTTITRTHREHTSCWFPIKTELKIGSQLNTNDSRIRSSTSLLNSNSRRVWIIGNRLKTG
jgi:hypothetical protein